MLASLILAVATLQPAPPGSAAEATALSERAEALVAQGDAAGAAALLERAAAIDAGLGAPRKEHLARDWMFLGLCLSALGRADEAIARLQDAAQAWRALEAHAETVESLQRLGLVELSHSRLASAQAHLEEALQLARAHDLDAAVPRLLNNLGMVSQAQGRDARALEQYQEALEQLEREQETTQAASTLGNIANLHLVAGRFGEAAAAYARARTAFDQAGDTSGSTITAINVGMVLLAEGRFDAARLALEDGLERARRASLGLAQASALLHLARVFEATGLFGEAAAAYTESLELFRGADNPQNTAAALTGLGSLYLTWGQGDRALGVAEEALALAERLSLPDQILSGLELVGDVHRRSGRPNAAILHYRRALEIAERIGRDGDTARIASSLGLAFFAWHKPTEAEKHFREALAIAERLGQRHGVAQSLAHLGAVRQVAGDAEGARDFYLRSLELSRAAGTTPDEAAALNDLGVLSLGLGERRQAEHNLIQAIALKERMLQTTRDGDRQTLLASWISSYRWLVHLRFLEGDAAAVFDASERMKARQLADRIEARASATEAGPLGIEAVRRDLAPSVAVVSFANVDWQQGVGVVATRDALQVYALEVADPQQRDRERADGREAAVLAGQMPRGLALAGQLSEYRALLALSEPSRVERGRRDTLARQLFRTLLGPGEALLAKAEEIVVIPDGALCLIPFETLRLPDGRYLVERHHVTYAPSLRVMQQLRHRRHRTHARSLLALGGTPPRHASRKTTVDVSERQLAALRATAERRRESGEGAAEVYAALGHDAWVDLPGARAEVEAIGRIVPGSLVLKGEGVSEARLKALSRAGTLRGFEILHFATHAVTVADAPELSALVLAEAGGRGTKEDGYLSVAEITDLDLQPDFVNLSACNSGVGPVYGGEGTVGLTQAFLEAGANGVSVSLWQLHDSFTRDFMIGLYRRVRQRRLTHARAMTEVKRSAIRRGTVEPSLWAPFVYYGID